MAYLHRHKLHANLYKEMPCKTDISQNALKMG